MSYFDSNRKIALKPLFALVTLSILTMAWLASAALPWNTALGAGACTTGGTVPGTIPSSCTCAGGTVPGTIPSSCTCAGGTVPGTIPTGVGCLTEDIQPMLTVTKRINNQFGTALQLSDFTLMLDSTTVTSGVANSTTVTSGVTTHQNVGSYVVSEVAVPGWTGVITGACDASGNVTLAAGDTKECIITNTPTQPTLKVTKVVNNQFGATAQVSDFTLMIYIPPFSPHSVTSGVATHQNVGSYVVSEVAVPGWTGVITGACDASGNVTLAAGDTKECIITNTPTNTPTHPGPTITTITTISPTSRVARSVEFLLTVNGTNFLETAKVQWDSSGTVTELATVFVSDIQLTATVPASLIPAANVIYVRVDNKPGLSNPMAFFVTELTAVPTSTAAATGTNPIASAGGSPGTAGAVSATATGTGTVSVAQFGTNNPGGAALSFGTGFIDVNVSQGSSFTQIVIQHCNLGGGGLPAIWFDGTNWGTVSPPPIFTAGPPACNIITVNNTTSPKLSDLFGTIFALQGTPPPADTTVIDKTFGDGQLAPIITELPTKLTATVVSGANREPLQGVTVQFQITGAPGQTLNGATLNNGTTTATTVTAITDSEGRAGAILKLGNVSGAYQVTASVAGKQVVFTAAACQLFPLSGKVIEIDPVTGNFVANVGGANVVIFSSALGLRFTTGHGGTAAGGTFSINVCAGDYALSVTKEGAGFAPIPDTAVSMSAADGQTPVAAKLVINAFKPGITISGAVTGVVTAGQASITFFEVDAGNNLLSGGSSGALSVPASGAWSFAGRAGANWRIKTSILGVGDVLNCAFADSLAGKATGSDPSRCALINVSANVTGVTFSLPVTSALTGGFTRDGAAVPNAMIFATPVTAAGVTPPTPGVVYADDGGFYSLPLQRPNDGTFTYTVNILDPLIGHLIARHVTVNAVGAISPPSPQNWAATTSNITFNFSTVVASGSVSATGPGAVQRTDTVTNASVVVLKVLSGQAGIPSVNYAIGVSVPGTTGVTFSPSSGTVPPNLLVNVTVPVFFTISGTLKDNLGAFLGGATVTASSPVFSSSATTSANGAYSIQIPGTTNNYKLSASKNGHVTSSLERVIGGSVVQDFTLQKISAAMPKIFGLVSGGGITPGVPVTVVATKTDNSKSYAISRGQTGPNCTAPPAVAPQVATPNHYCIEGVETGTYSVTAYAENFVTDTTTTVPVIVTVVSRDAPGVSTDAPNTNIVMKGVKSPAPESVNCQKNKGCHGHYVGSSIFVTIPAGALGTASDLITLVKDETTEAPSTATFESLFTTADGDKAAINLTILGPDGVPITRFNKPIMFRIEGAGVTSGKIVGYYNTATGDWTPLNSCVFDDTGVNCIVDHFSKFAVLSSKTSALPSGGGGGSRGSAGSISTPTPTPTPTQGPAQQAPAPKLRSPLPGALVTNMGPQLQWETPPGATQYHLRVIPANDDGPGINLYVGDLALVQSGSYQIQAPRLGVGNYVMLPGMTYTWRLRVATAPKALPLDDPAWSVAASGTFVTQLPTSAFISPVAPSVGGTVTSTTPTLTWNNIFPSIFYYEIQIAREPSFNTDPATAIGPVYWELVHGGQSQPTNSYAVKPGTALQNGKDYFWRVRARVQGDGPRDGVGWSDTWSFSTPK